MNERKKRVLLFIKTPPPITGATLMNQLVYDSKLLREHFNIRSIKISYSNNVDGIGTYSLNKVRKIITVYFLLLNELLLHRPHFVYFQISPLGVAFYRDLIFISLIKILKIKIVYHLHGKGIKNAAKKKWKKRLYCFAFKGEEVICLSQLLTYDVEGLYNSQIHIVNNGIPETHKKLLPETSEEKTFSHSVLFLSNLIEAKGVINFLDALEILKNKGVKLKGEIIGEEADITKRDLNQIIQKKNLDKIVFYLGPKYKEDKQKAFNRNSVFVLPTKNDCFPSVLIEAMSHLLPIISTLEGAVPDIVDDGKTGFLVDKNCPEQIAEKLEILLKNPKLRKNMGEAGRKKYEEKYTIRKFEENLSEVFHKV